MSLRNESQEHADERKVRYAVVGAGWISQEYFMPGVEHTLRAIEEALASGMPKPVMPRSERQARPCWEQIIRLPGVKSEELIGAGAPGGS